jgi:hypothetical protein
MGSGGRTTEWKSGRVEEWKNDRVEEWKNDRVEEWKKIQRVSFLHSFIPPFLHSSIRGEARSGGFFHSGGRGREGSGVKRSLYMWNVRF